MEKYWEIFVNGYKGYGQYLWNEITHPHLTNYFYWLIGVSLFFFALELIKPWRVNQPKFRKDFWLDAFYMFFNFFLFSLIIFNGLSDVIVNFFNDSIIALSGFDLQANNPLNSFPYWSVLLVGFIVRDFVQWWTHRMLHRVEWMWQFHKIHHSIKQMGFAGHLRYHWMETIIYRTMEYLPLALLGLGLYDFFIIHLMTLAIGHYNHSNIQVKGTYSAGAIGVFVGVIVVNELQLESLDMVTWMVGIPLVFAFGMGPLMKYIFNSPEMHIWHHAYELPKDKPYGINFGISLAIWDYIFGTARIPEDGRDIELGFPKDEEVPDSFVGQAFFGFRRSE